ncbi:sensor domain-containing diguanylate cyclase [Solibacillus sp. CAU 1738]|uniref:sensor domain-containing diguanylate cyclase n=1 Tax=Solibacillus sp. CAU 1738 TaxID=3140363 RepID=UPI0032602C6F
MLEFGKTRWVLFSVWFSVVFLAFIVVEKYTIHVPIPPFVFLTFCTIAIIAAFWPVSVGHRKFLIIQWLTVPIMMNYGVIVELFLYQIALIPYLWRVNTKVANLRTLPIYSLYFFFLPLFTYIILYLAGLKVGLLSFKEVVFYATLNQVIFVLLGYAFVNLCLFRVKHTFQVKKELLIMLFAIPFMIALYYLIHNISPLASLFALMCYLPLSALMRSLDTSLMVNENLHLAVKLSQKLSVSNSREQALSLFMDKLFDIVSVDEAYLIHDRDELFELVYARTSEPNVQYLHEESNYIADVYNTGKVIYLSNHRQWILEKCPFPFRFMESLAIIPLKRDEHVVAALIVGSKKSQAFEQFQINLIDLLATNLVLSLERIRFIENTISKSERCALTNIYNYRFIDERISEMTRLFDNGSLKSVSLIMLDIDYFKVINDTYGHESGNIIIKTFAKQLQSLVEDDMILARYGGEEFVILMPNTTKEEALIFAEEIRQKTALTTYKVVTELDDQPAEVSIYITLSIGVSSAPEDTNDVQRLIANADRALYVGAKRNGRNRVASYRDSI